MSTRHNDRSSTHPVKRLSGDHPKLEKCPRKPRTLGLADIRKTFGKESLLIRKGDFIYNVSAVPQLYEKGV